jgi:hypothetical protein
LHPSNLAEGNWSKAKPRNSSEWSRVNTNKKWGAYQEFNGIVTLAIPSSTGADKSQIHCYFKFLRCASIDSEQSSQNGEAKREKERERKREKEEREKEREREREKAIPSF